MLTKRKYCGVDENKSENYSDCICAQVESDCGAGQRAYCSGDFQEHPHAYVGKTFSDVSGGCTGRCSDYRNESGADGVPDVDSENEGEERNDDDSAAKAGKRAEKSGKQRAERYQEREFQRVQAVLRPLLSEIFRENLSGEYHCVFPLHAPQRLKPAAIAAVATEAAL
jgi:hypothetical protein